MSSPLPSGADAVDRLAVPTGGASLRTMVVEALHHPHATAVGSAVRAVLGVWLAEVPAPQTRPDGVG